MPSPVDRPPRWRRSTTQRGTPLCRPDPLGQHPLRDDGGWRGQRRRHCLFRARHRWIAHHAGDVQQHQRGIPWVGSLTLSGSTLYGTTNEGGASGYGTVFSVPLAGGSPTTLATFNNTNGEYPFAGLTLSGNTLYGTTYEGGASGYGTVFS